MKTLRYALLSFMAMLATTMSAQQMIRISTEKTDLIMQVAPNGRLYQTYLGDRLQNDADLQHLQWQTSKGADSSFPERGREVYVGSGGDDTFEPAITIIHADGRQDSYFYFQDCQQQSIPGGTETVITLRDKLYPDQVVLHYKAYDKENVITVWSEISHQEKGSVRLSSYGSAVIYFDAAQYFLTNYHSDWAKEGQPESQRLAFGKKIIDSKLGSAAAEYSEPFFELGINGTVRENEGQVMLGVVGWTGNFRCTFEVDNTGQLRVVPGINSDASSYVLAKGKVFKTPEFVFTLSSNGSGEASRNLHRWARNYQVKDGKGDRMTLLNNWENTGFKFDQDMIVGLIGDAKDLGVDMFLLDDGWFANKYPRDDDKAGLGDWAPNWKKLPQGIKALTDAAQRNGIKFGLWIEPEMVNPKSELFEKHPDWAMKLPGRDPRYQRNQLVLDLSNPTVQDYVFGVVDKLLTDNPGIAYFKWDCNSYLASAYSPYLGKLQGNMYIDHVRGLYNIMSRVREKYPTLPMMLCSGGGGRCDYEALKYFTEFWMSDDTDPFERLYQQWSFSKFFPTKTLAAHVTNWNRKSSMKFRMDVASMGKLGFDINLKNMDPDDLAYVKRALKEYNRVKPVILEGDMYRLVSPYETDHMAVCYVSADRSRAVLFAYDLHPRYKEPQFPVRLQGLDATRSYQVREINTANGQTAETKTYTGDYLMKVGLPVLTPREGQSHVYEIW